MKAVTIAIAAALAATPAFAGSEPSRSPAPYYYAPPVIVTAPPPNPLVGLGAGIGGAVGGLASLPFVVLGGLFSTISPPPAPLCVAPDGSLFPCSSGPGPAYPLPTYEPDSGPQEPPSPSFGTPMPPDPTGPFPAPQRSVHGHSSGQACYDRSGSPIFPPPDGCRT
jgi:hypothetical protein